MGIFVGQGISDCYALITAHRLRRMVLRFLPAEEAPLPLYNNNYTPELHSPTSNLQSDSSKGLTCVCEEFSGCGCDDTQTAMPEDTLTSTSADNLNSIFEDTRANASLVVLTDDFNNRPIYGRKSERSSRYAHGSVPRDTSDTLEGPVDNPWALE